MSARRERSPIGSCAAAARDHGSEAASDQDRAYDGWNTAVFSCLDPDFDVPGAHTVIFSLRNGHEERSDTKNNQDNSDYEDGFHDTPLAAR